jgi:hypothetical protein
MARNGTIPALTSIAMTFVSEQRIGSDAGVVAGAQEIVEDFLSGALPYAAARVRFERLVGFTDPLDKLHRVLETESEPIPTPLVFLSDPKASARHKTRPWTPYEDQRLLCGIYRFGMENWTAISRFVGNARSRSQCSQRWYRGLDPTISKIAWTPEEEDRLTSIVAQIGDASWTRIAAKMGNRNDVQCRYKYKQLQKRQRNIRPQPEQAAPVARLELPLVANLTQKELPSNAMTLLNRIPTGLRTRPSLESRYAANNRISTSARVTFRSRKKQVTDQSGG